MTSTRHQLHATLRTVVGKKVKRDRAAGKIPGSVFGKHIASENIFVENDAFTRVWRKVGGTGVVDLVIDAKTPRPVLIQTVSLDPIKKSIQNISLYQVNLREKVKAEVPVNLVGEALATKNKLGIVVQLVNELSVEALPTDLPEQIEIDISTLSNVGDMITVAQISLPNTVNVLLEKDTPLVQITGLAKPEEEKAPVVTETTVQSNEPAPSEEATG